MRIAHGPIMNIDHTRGSYLFFTIFPHVCPENREIGAAKIVSVKPIPAPNSTLKPPTKKNDEIRWYTLVRSAHVNTVYLFVFCTV